MRQEEQNKTKKFSNGPFPLWSHLVAPLLKNKVCMNFYENFGSCFLECTMKLIIPDMYLYFLKKTVYNNLVKILAIIYSQNPSIALSRRKIERKICKYIHWDFTV